MVPVKNFSYKREVLRKLIHFSSAIFPAILFYFGKNISIPIFLIFTLTFIVFDFLRMRNVKIKKLYLFFFNYVTRPSEESKLTGATYVFISILFISIFFSKETALASLLIMSISDPFAALVGRSFGSFSILNKSLEGSISFFVITFLILFLLNFDSLVILTVASFCTIIELFSKKINIDDNLLVPICASLLLSIF